MTDAQVNATGAMIRLARDGAQIDLARTRDGEIHLEVFAGATHAALVLRDLRAAQSLAALIKAGLFALDSMQPGREGMPELTPAELWREMVGGPVPERPEPPCPHGENCASCGGGVR